MKNDWDTVPRQRGRAREMRRAPTEAERILWLLLRDRRLCGLKFRRQVPVGPYIVDFLCVDKRLIVEADGSQHAHSVDDARRDQFLAAAGWTVLRFWNSDILQEGASVLNSILARAGMPW